MHLKNQRNVCFIVLMAEGNMEIYELKQKNLFRIIFVAQIGSKWSENHKNRPKFALRFFSCFFNLVDLGKKKIVTDIS